MPPPLQQRVHEEVELTKRRSGWPARRTLTALGIARRTYYRWLKEEAWALEEQYLCTREGRIRKTQVRLLQGR